MPIRGLSDRQHKRMPRVGVIRLGIKEKNAKGQEYPKAVDYFVCKADDSTPEDAAVAFHEVYGDKPREITVVFPTDAVEDWADPFYRKYSQSFGLVCRGTGEQALARWDPNQDGPRPEGVESGTWANGQTKQWIHQTIPCPAELCPSQTSNPPSCRRTMALQFILPDVRGIGVWSLMTGSWNSIINVHSMAESFLESFGRIRGVPFQLCIEPQEVIPPGGVKKKRVWVLNLRQPAVSMNELFAQVARLPERTLMLPPAVDEEPPDDVDLIEIEGQVVNEKTGEIVDEHEKRPEQPCKYCDVLLDVEDEWLQMQHGPGKCVVNEEINERNTESLHSGSIRRRGDGGVLLEEGEQEREALRQADGENISERSAGAGLRTGGDRVRIDPSPTSARTAVGSQSHLHRGVRSGSAASGGDQAVPDSEGGSGGHVSGARRAIREEAGEQSATDKSDQLVDCPKCGRSHRRDDVHDNVVEQGRPTTSSPVTTATSSPATENSLVCGSCGSTIDLRRDSQADINSHQTGECRTDPRADDDLAKYAGWQPTNIGGVLTQAWRLFKMDRPTVEEITGKLSPQMNPGELASAWEKVFESKVAVK